MEITTLAKRFLKLCPFLCLLLLIALTLLSLHSAFASEKGNIDAAKDMLMKHMDFMVQQSPGMEDTKRQVEEQLRNGKMPHEACSHCHITGSQGSAGS